MKVAVTGASGFLGRQVVDSLLKKGDRVVAVGRNPPPIRGSRDRDLFFFESAYDFESLVTAFEGTDAVVHLAARRLAPPSEGMEPFVEANIRTAENAVRAAVACRVKRFVFASSISVYSSSNPVPFNEAQNPEPENFYGLSKLVGERLIQTYSQNTPMRSIILRLSTLFGRNDTFEENFVTSVFIRRAVHKQPLQVWGEGKGGRDLLYLKDALAALEKALASDATAGIFNIGAGQPYSFLEIAETVNEVFDNSGNLMFDSYRKEDTVIRWMDCSHAESKLKWRRMWSLKTGLLDMKGDRA